MHLWFLNRIPNTLLLCPPNSRKCELKYMFLQSSLLFTLFVVLSVLFLWDENLIVNCGEVRKCLWVIWSYFFPGRNTHGRDSWGPFQTSLSLHNSTRGQGHYEAAPWKVSAKDVHLVFQETHEKRVLRHNYAYISKMFYSKISIFCSTFQQTLKQLCMPLF